MSRVIGHPDAWLIACRQWSGTSRGRDGDAGLLVFGDA